MYKLIKDKEEEKLLKGLKDCLTSVLIALLIVLVSMLFCAIAHAQHDDEIIASVIFAEQDNPLATKYLLNTYNNINPNKSLIQNIKQHSCAYRFKSKRYTLAVNRQFKNSIDKRNYNAILAQVKSFIPDSSIKYIKHESPHFYKRKGDTKEQTKKRMIKVLKSKWGAEVDYNSAILIHGQYYFVSK